MSGLRISEPNFQNEDELQNAIASAIQNALDADDSTRAVVLPRFGLDLAVLTEQQPCKNSLPVAERVVV